LTVTRESIKINIKIKESFHVIGVITFYILLFTIFFSPVLFSNRLLAPSDGIIYYFPGFYWDSGLWNQYLFSGFPQFADPQLMTWYLPRLLFKTVASFNAFVLSAYVMAACFTYGYVYKLTQSKGSALLSGICFSMSGFLIAHLGHTTIIHAAAWLPLMIWGFEELKHKFSAKWLVITASAVALCCLAGHSQIFVFSLGLCGLYVIIMTWYTTKSILWKYFLRAGIAVLIGVLLASIQLIPSLELSMQSLRASMDYQAFVSFSLNIKQTVMLLFPYVFGGSELLAYPYFGVWNLTELAGYVGWIPLILAGIALVIKFNNRHVIFWASIAIIALLLSLGDATPLAKLMFHVPIYNLFRAPARHLMEFVFAISVLAGIGLNEIRNQKLHKHVNLYIIIAVLAMINMSLLLIMQIDPMGVDGFTYSPVHNPAIAIPLVLALMSTITVIWLLNTNKKHLVSLILILIVVADLSSFGWFYEWKDCAPRQIGNVQPRIIESGDYRIAPIDGWLANFEQIKPNISLLSNTNSISGYGPLVLTKYHELSNIWPAGNFGDQQLSPDNQALNILATKYVYINDSQSITFDGVAWSMDNLTGFENSTNKEFSILTDKVNADQIGIVSSLGCSTHISDMTEVAKIEITYSDNSVEHKSVCTGRDTSEWAYDRIDVRNEVQHQKARVFESFAGGKDLEGNDYEGHRYVAYFNINGSKLIKSIKISSTCIEPVSIKIDRISLYNTRTMESWPVTNRSSILSDSSRWQFIRRIGSGMLYENRYALPRVWVVSDVKQLSRGSILETIKTSRLPDGSKFDPGYTALVDRDINFVSSSPEIEQNIHLLNNEGDHVKIKTDLTQNGFLVLSDVYYPGWNAYIDGQQVQLYETNYILRGVEVPAGSHVVEFKFEPISFVIGVALTILGLLIIAGILIYGPLVNRGKKKEN